MLSKINLEELKAKRLAGISNRDLGRYYKVSFVTITNRCKKIKFTDKELKIIHQKTQEKRVSKFAKSHKIRKQKDIYLIKSLKKKGFTKEILINRYNTKISCIEQALEKGKKYIRFNKKNRVLKNICLELEQGIDARLTCYHFNITIQILKTWLKQFGVTEKELRYYLGHKKWRNVLKLREFIKNGNLKELSIIAKKLNISNYTLGKYILEEASGKNIISKPDFSNIYNYFKEMDKIKKNIYDTYKQGYSFREVSVITGYTDRTIRNVIIENT
jgi:hypothetical protein